MMMHCPSTTSLLLHQEHQATADVTKLLLQHAARVNDGQRAALQTQILTLLDHNRTLMHYMRAFSSFGAAPPWMACADYVAANERNRRCLAERLELLVALRSKIEGGLATF